MDAGSPLAEAAKCERAAPQTPADAAHAYLRRGWFPVPIPARTKRPVLKGWPDLRLTDADIPKIFGSNANIGLILGEPSGWLVDVDLDCEEARELADLHLPPTPAITGRPSAPNSHRWYIAHRAVTAKHTDPKSKAMIVELRSTGTQTIVGPSIHPEGEAYDVLTGEPAHVPAPMLAACVASLADAVVTLRHGAVRPASAPAVRTPVPASHDDFDVEQRAIAYLGALPPAISGQGGHAAAYTAAVALVHGFGIVTERALGILLTHYNPRCQPPWSERELRHKVDDAANKPHEFPYAWLRDSPRHDETLVDLSGIVGKAMSVDALPSSDVTCSEPKPSGPIDPGPLPEHLLRIPGFVAEVMDHCLDTAPYPNVVLSFAGALALQAFLAGRKVRDQADNRTNLYLLGLAYSSAGKDQPRKLNTRIIHEVGLAGGLGEKFTSGEAIQDALNLSPCMLFQTDEIDGMLQSINKAKDARHESTMGTLLTMYSSANSVYPMRRKANPEATSAIDQPCLIVYGTAIPNHYYEALSERMLTNGFFARMVILECPSRSPGKEPGLLNPPARVLDTARWWADFHPGTGNLDKWHPVPAVVEYTPEAQNVFIESRIFAEAKYSEAEAQGDPVGTTVWGRVNEQARKLSLLYAISRDHKTPSIDKAAAEWATTLVVHQTQRMLFMAQNHAAANPFHAECLKFIRKLREAPDHTLPHSVLLKRMKVDSQAFQHIVQTLTLQGDVECVSVPTPGRYGIAYRLLAP